VIAMGYGSTIASGSEMDNEAHTTNFLLSQRYG